MVANLERLTLEQGRVMQINDRYGLALTVEQYVMARHTVTGGHLMISFGDVVGVWLGEHTGKQGKLAAVYGDHVLGCTVAQLRTGDGDLIVVPAAYVDPNPCRLEAKADVA